MCKYDNSRTNTPSSGKYLEAAGAILRNPHRDHFALLIRELQPRNAPSCMSV